MSLFGWGLEMAVANSQISGTPTEPRHASKSITFDGAAGKGAIGTGTVFTVTGEVLIEKILPFCTTLIGVDAGTGVASMQLGVGGATPLLVPSTSAIDIDADEFWEDATPSANGVAAPAALKDVVITQDIQFEVTSTGTQKVNSGVIRFDVWWRPLSPDGTLS